MKTNTELQRDILEELQWEPSVDAAEVGVTVHDGVVTLAGRVPTFAEKLAAERATQRVVGVKAVANDLEVLPHGQGKRTDSDIATAAVDALEWHASVPSERIKVIVSKGWVTLDGEVDWQYQKKAAKNAVRHLLGVRGIVDNIAVKPKITAAEVKSRIDAAFRRSAEVDADKVQIEVDGGRIVLRGEVRSWSERQEAERTAWAAPGVTAVENRIAVVPYITSY